MWDVEVRNSTIGLLILLNNWMASLTLCNLDINLLLLSTFISWARTLESLYNRLHMYVHLVHEFNKFR